MDHCSVSPIAAHRAALDELFHRFVEPFGMTGDRHVELKVINP